jgi:hypothetical protein
VRFWRGLEPRASRGFFLHIFKFNSQNASSASGNEIQQRKKAVKERRGCRDHLVQVSRAENVFQIMYLVRVHPSFLCCENWFCKTGLRTAILLRSVLSGGAHAILVGVCVCRGVGGVGGVRGVGGVGGVGH